MPALRNKRHERFLQQWLGGKTRADAWTSVTGRRSSDYASRVGNRPEVLARMAALKAEQEETQRKAVAAAAARFEVTAERVIRDLARIAFANLMDFVKIGPDGKPRPDYPAISFDQGAALERLTVKEATTKAESDDGTVLREVTLKLRDKRLALVALARHLGLFDKAGGA